MSIVCTLYNGGRKYGSILAVSRDKDSIATIKAGMFEPTEESSSNTIYIMCDIGLGSRIDMTFSTATVVDEPLRTLSSNDYVITTANQLMHKNEVYTLSADLPEKCQWKAMPFIKVDDLIDYTSESDRDMPFLLEGYARDLKDAKHVLIPSDWSLLNERMALPDLLIMENGKASSGRTPVSGALSRMTGRYVALIEPIAFKGSIRIVPYTYTMQTLYLKYAVLNKRLQEYGKGRISSMSLSLDSLSKKISEPTDHFKASSLYDDIVTFLEKMHIVA